METSVVVGSVLFLGAYDAVEGLGLVIRAGDFLAGIHNWFLAATEAGFLLQGHFEELGCEALHRDF